MPTKRLKLPLIQRRPLQQLLQPRIKTNHLLPLFPPYVPVHGVTQYAVAVVDEFRLRCVQERGENDDEEEDEGGVAERCGAEEARERVRVGRC